MPAETPSPQTSEPASGRRATDAAHLKFEQAALKSIEPGKTAFAAAEVETINMDSVLPFGSEVDFHRPQPAAATAALTTEQKKTRLAMVKFKQSFDNFAVTGHLSQVNIATIKRGDAIEIKTIVGSIYLRVLDRIKFDRSGSGEILCECRYDLGDQCELIHAASIQLPICTHRHVIANADGSKRAASRTLKMTTEEALPPHVSKLLHENFFTEIAIYANPQGEKLRLLDVGRWLARIALKIKAIIDENNRHEREKQQKKEKQRAAAARQ